VENLIGNQGVVSDKSPWDESTLVRRNDLMKDRFEPISNGFGYDF
jgi:hypothetical protein